jgi:hypothetical protein
MEASPPNARNTSLFGLDAQLEAPLDDARRKAA